MMKRRMKMDWDFVLTMVLAVVVIIVGFMETAAPAINKVVDEREVVVTVVDKGIKNHNKNSQYLIYCVDEKDETQVFQVSDSLFQMRFDSSDMYPNITVGKTYKFTICGKRVHFLSWYPNIYQYEEIIQE